VWMEQRTPGGQARVAEGDPRRGQGFTPVGQKSLTFLPGDRLTATCDFDSTSRTVWAFCFQGFRVQGRASVFAGSAALL
jgi:hypothetical protein